MSQMDTTARTAVLRLEGVSASFGLTRAQPVDLEIAPGDRVLVFGPSGSGKTSLLYVMAQLASPAAGRVLVGAEEHQGRRAQARARAEQVSFVAQDAALVEHWSVRMNLEAMCGQEGARAAARLLASWDVPHGREQPRTLSGGERQRVVVAAALARRTPLIVADEPTSSLDATAKEQVVRALTDAAADAAVVIASHDPVWSTWPTQVLDLGGTR